MSVLRPLLFVALALASYLVGTVLIRATLPPPRLNWPKLDSFFQHRDEYDAVFIGSSVIYRSIRPRIIDPIVSTSGKRFRSFNLGMDGMRGLETDHLLDRVIASKSARLRYVIVELPRWEPRTENEISEFTYWQISWHTPRTMMTLLKTLQLQLGLEPQAQLETAWGHFRMFVLWQGNVGMAGQIRDGFNLGRSRRQSNWIEQADPARGYKPLEVNVFAKREKNHQRFLARFTEIAKRRSSQAARRREGIRSGPEFYNTEALRDQRDRIAAAGLKPIYIVTPTKIVRPIPELFVTDPDDFPLIEINLFRLDTHFDVVHLSENGALEYSRLVAEQLIRLRRGLPPEDGYPSGESSPQ